MLKKLFCYGFHDTSFDWLHSYLSDRKQQVLVNNVLSDILDEKPFGVPQGSVLGPLLFLIYIYINDINKAITSSYFHLYADDTIIIQSHDDPLALVQNMETELINIHEWFVLHKLTANKKKCQTIFFGSSNQLKKCDDLTVNFNEQAMETKTTVKYLGVHFDSSLTWKKHTSEIRKKINFKFSKLKPVAKFLEPNDINMLIRSLIHPYIHYCSTTWFSAAPYLIHKLQSTCDKTHLLSPHIHSINVEQRLKHDLAILSFKALKKLTPSYISNYLEVISDKHKYATRQSANNNIFCSSNSSKMSTKSIKYTIPKLWNNLPTNLKLESSLVRFKRNCKCYFLNN